MADVAAAWDREAVTFDIEPDHGLRDADVREAWRTLLNAHLPVPPTRIADLGCGTGSLAVLLAEEGHDVTGADFSGQMLAQARWKAAAVGASLDLALGDAARPPFRAGAFDVVICRHVLWALEDIDDALENWTTLLRQGGCLLLIEGQWSTGGGLPAEELTNALGRLGRSALVKPLSDEPQLWGREVDDDRYLILS